jgi:hypothetical protein
MHRKTAALLSCVNLTVDGRGMNLSGEKIEILNKLIATVIFFSLNIYHGSMIHIEYPTVFVSLYPYPLWRVLILIFLLAAANWCPRLAIMITFTVFFYLMDMQHLVEPFHGS